LISQVRKLKITKYSIANINHIKLRSMKNRFEVGIFIFNEADVLDFSGPFEVFSLTEKNREKLFNVNLISEHGRLITARNGYKVMPSYDFSNHPDLDILIIPGGYGAEEIEIKNTIALKWITSQYEKVQILASVCTGALLLAECGILDNKKATTHWMDYDRLEQEYPKVNVIRKVKYVDEGKVLTSGGISSGINMCFHLIQRLFDADMAKFTAKRMEYDIEI